MKTIKKVKSLPVNSAPKIKLSHGQSIKQSANYQSADASYSAELVVENTPDEIKKGIKYLETLVEEALALKVTQQRKFLLRITEEGSYEAQAQTKSRRGRFSS